MSEMKKDLFSDVRDTVREHYTFCFSAEEYKPVTKKYKSAYNKRMTVIVAFALLIIAFGIFADEPLFLGFGIGGLPPAIGVYARTMSVYKARNSKFCAELSRVSYDFTLYDSYLIVWISSDTSIRQRKFAFKEIKRAEKIGGLVVLEMDDALWILRASDLIPNSWFIRICGR